MELILIQEIIIQEALLVVRPDTGKEVFIAVAKFATKAITKSVRSLVLSITSANPARRGVV
jgi:hypothetical protein